MIKTGEKSRLLLDLGSSTLRIFHDGKEIFHEEYQGEKIKLLSRGIPNNIDLTAVYLKKVFRQKKINWWRQDLVCLLPSSITTLEKEIFAEVLAALNLGKWRFLPKFKAAADLSSLIIDIGAETTELLLPFSQEATGITLPIGSHSLDEIIIRALRKHYQFEISAKTAENIKKQIKDKNFLSHENKSAKMNVRGKNLLEFLPETKTIDMQTFQNDFLLFFENLVQEILIFFSQLDIDHSLLLDRNLVLTGSGAALSALPTFFAAKFSMTVEYRPYFYVLN